MSYHSYKLVKLAISTIILTLSLTHLSAIDNDGSGVSDVYEAWVGRSLQANDDDDGDGYSNLLESLMGTDALDSQSPAWTVQKETDRFRFRFPNSAHTQFRLLMGTDLKALSSGDYVIGDGDGELILYSNNFSTGPATFFALDFGQPLNSDSDALDDFEETLLGTNISESDSDADYFSDSDEFVHGTNPLSDVDTPVLATKQAWSNAYVVRNSGDYGTYSKQTWSNAYIIRNVGNYGTYSKQAWSNAYVIVNTAPE